MGDWTVLIDCYTSGVHALPVVEQHQADVVAEEPKPLKFTVAVAYQKGAGSMTIKPSDRRGWHWSVSWFAPASGKLEMRTGYGYDTKEEAKFDAEALADIIALANLPEDIYTYTPEVP